MMTSLIIHMCALHKMPVIRTGSGLWHHIRNTGTLGPECGGKIHRVILPLEYDDEDS